MAAVNTARIKSSHTMHDGRKYVTEEVVDTQGNFHPRLYLAAAGEDSQAHLVETQAQYEASLTEDELASHLRQVVELGGDAVISLKFVTPGNLRSYLREHFRDMHGVEVGRMAEFLLTMTDNQLKTLFSANDVQLVPLKQRLQQRADTTNTVDSYGGE